MTWFKFSNEITLGDAIALVTLFGSILTAIVVWQQRRRQLKAALKPVRAKFQALNEPDKALLGILVDEDNLTQADVESRAKARGIQYGPIFSAELLSTGFLRRDDIEVRWTIPERIFPLVKIVSDEHRKRNPRSKG